MAEAKRRTKSARVKRRTAKRGAAKAAPPKNRGGAKKAAGKRPRRGEKTAAKRAAAAKRAGTRRSAKTSAPRRAEQEKAKAARERARAASRPAGGRPSGALRKAAERTVRRATRTVRRAARQLVRTVAPAARPAGRPTGRVAARKVPARTRAGIHCKGRCRQGRDRTALRGGADALPRSPSSPICIANSTRPAGACSSCARERQTRFDAGELPDFLAETHEIRDGDWKVAPIPPDLLDRRVEITGPVDRKMVINALNSGAKVFMADFEDANSPTWANNDRGPDQPEGPLGRHARLHRPGERQGLQARRQAGGAARPPARLASARRASDGRRRADFGCAVRFRALFLPQRREADRAGHRARISTCRSSRAISRRGCGTTSSSTRRSKLGLPIGTIKATVLIETLPAAFEMDEILYELRDHIAGLNAGRWDYIFSFIKKLAKNPDYVLPDRGQVVMGKAFLGAYAELLMQDLPPPRRLRHGRHGGADSGRRTIRRPTRPPSPRCAPTRSARRATATTAPGSRIPTSCRSPRRCSTA